MSKEYLEVVELYKSLEKEKDEEKNKIKRISLDSVVNLTLNRSGFKFKEEHEDYRFYQRNEEVFVKRDIADDMSSEFDYAFATINPDDFEEFKGKCCVKAYPNYVLISNSTASLVILGEFCGGLTTGAITGGCLDGVDGALLGSLVGAMGSILSITGSAFWLDKRGRKKNKKKIKNFDEEYKENIIYNEQALERLFRGDIK